MTETVALMPCAHCDAPPFTTLETTARHRAANVYEVEDGEIECFAYCISCRANTGWCSSARVMAAKWNALQLAEKSFPKMHRH